ncbi:MAG TPA: PH domain-containing protein [Actinomycetes bacterium]|nr:PH domain-containing protein [Actinomycetes bacterium]
MPFPERLLGENEQVVYDLRPHWWTLVGPALLALLIVVVTSLAWGFMPGGNLQGPARLGVQAVGLAALLFWVAPRVVRWATTHFVLTTDRLIFRRGFLSRYAREIPLERINDVTFSQSVFERLLGAGDLVIESAGEHGQNTFYNIRNPEAVQLEIYHRMEENGQRMLAHHATPPQPQAYGRAPSALDDLERLAALRERGALSDAEFEQKKRDLLDRL